MRGWVAVAVMSAWTGTAHAEQRRELAPHEHGHSRLNLAVDGTRVAMEIAAPGMDVLGFEHAAATAADEAAVAAGKAALAEPLRLFVPPPAAGCRMVESEVQLQQEDGAGAEEELHSEFAGRYLLDCADPDALTEITFAWFDRFPGAKEVEVTLVTAKGQTSFEVARGAGPLALGTAF